MSTAMSRHTVEEYFEVEMASEHKHEYVDGEILEMVGGSTPHNDICGNLYFLLKANFRKPDFRICCGNSRMRTANPLAYLYPDAAVIKGAGEYESQRLDTVLNPTVLFEILSPSTEQFDRGRKFDLYKTIASLEEYLLISQQDAIVERFSREIDGRWKSERFTGLNSVVKLGSLGWDLPLVDLYADIDFTAQ
ncbi:MAG: Uma2 family endonuclease [Planctomycetota bacterium]